MFQVNWAPSALNTYIQTLTYLQNERSVKAAKKLYKEVDKLIKRLEIHSHLCPPSKIIPSKRKCVISKYSSLIYTINETNNAIEVEAFLDNRSNHLY